MRQLFWADRGQSLSLDHRVDEGAVSACMGAARLGSLQTSGAAFTVWLQLRGSSWVEAKEGKFRLHRGEWIAFEKESRPLVQAGRDGLCIGVSLNAEALRTLGELADCGLYAGRGRTTRHEARVALRLWRDGAQPDSGTQSLRPILLHLASLQRELLDSVQRCPGRSRSRKRQVFGRMQRARLYLEATATAWSASANWPSWPTSPAGISPRRSRASTRKARRRCRRACAWSARRNCCAIPT